MTRILRHKDVQAMFGISRTTLWRWVRDGHFPAPIKLTPRTVGWRENVVEEWLDSRPDTRQPAA